MKQRLITFLLLGLSAIAHADEYSIRVDGLACPFCAYGIEKKLKAIHGVEDIDIDLDKGKVYFTLNNSERLLEADMKTLFNDSGFTFRSMQVKQNEQ